MSTSCAFSYAPGKLILGGEHAVVYGYPAIALPLDRGVHIAIREKPDTNNGPFLRASGLGFVCEVSPEHGSEGPELMRLALRELLVLFGDRIKKLEMIVESTIPGGRGLGSSAALSVAMVRGLSRFLGQALTSDEEAMLALRLEKVFHGNPSGVDHTVIAQAKALLFQKEQGQAQTMLLQSPRELHFAIGLASPHGGTLQAVQALRDRRERYPHLHAHLFEGIAQVVLAMKDALESGRLCALGDLMNINQGYLNALGVSTPELESLCCIARRRGALGAKLTGAGGGGAVIALCDGNVQEVVDAFSAAGFAAFATSYGVVTP